VLIARSGPILFPDAGVILKDLNSLFPSRPRLMSPERFHSFLHRLSRCLPAPDPHAIPPYQLAEESALLVPIVKSTGGDALPGFRRSRLAEALALADPALLR
jgi:hypothetical protein